MPPIQDELDNQLVYPKKPKEPEDNDHNHRAATSEERDKLQAAINLLGELELIPPLISIEHDKIHEEVIMKHKSTEPLIIKIGGRDSSKLDANDIIRLIQEERDKEYDVECLGINSTYFAHLLSVLELNIKILTTLLDEQSFRALNTTGTGEVDE